MNNQKNWKVASVDVVTFPARGMFRNMESLIGGPENWYLTLASRSRLIIHAGAFELIRVEDPNRDIPSEAVVIETKSGTYWVSLQDWCDHVGRIPKLWLVRTGGTHAQPYPYQFRELRESIPNWKWLCSEDVSWFVPMGIGEMFVWVPADADEVAHIKARNLLGRMCHAVLVEAQGRKLANPYIQPQQFEQLVEELVMCDDHEKFFEKVKGIMDPIVVPEPVVLIQPNTAGQVPDQPVRTMGPRQKVIQAIKQVKTNANGALNGALISSGTMTSLEGMVACGCEVTELYQKVFEALSENKKAHGSAIKHRQPAAPVDQAVAAVDAVIAELNGDAFECHYPRLSADDMATVRNAVVELVRRKGLKMIGPKAIRHELEHRSGTIRALARQAASVEPADELAQVKADLEVLGNWQNQFLVDCAMDDHAAEQEAERAANAPVFVPGVTINGAPLYAN